MSDEKRLAVYARQHRLDLKKYPIIYAGMTRSFELVVLQQSSCDYCVQFRGGGKYFPDLASATDYMATRWKGKLVGLSTGSEAAGRATA